MSAPHLQVPAPPTALARGPRLTLWPLQNHHIRALQAIINDVEIRSSWRTRGALWAPDQLHAYLARDSLTVGVATYGDTPESTVVGLVELLDPNFLDARAQLSLVSSRQFLGTSLGIEMCILFLGYAFDAYPLEKVQIEVHADNARLVPGLRRLLDHEGTFKRHLRINGTWHDVDVFALWKSDMPRLRSRLSRMSPEESR